MEQDSIVNGGVHQRRHRQCAQLEEALNQMLDVLVYPCLPLNLLGNLALADVRLLWLLQERTRLTLPQVCRRLSMGRSNAHRSLARLRRRGLLSRYVDPCGRRSVSIRLTRKGRLLIAEMEERSLALLQAACSSLSSEEGDAVRHGLEILLRAMNRAEIGA